MIYTLEQKITEIIKQTLEDLGFEIVKISIKGAKIKILEILIDRLDGEKVSVNDCKKVNRNISTLLDVEDIFEHEYNLEVSSAGIERPLTSLQNYIRFTGSNVQIRLKELLNNCGHYRGVITSCDDNIINLQLKNNENLRIPFDLIKSGHLVMTDEMFRQLLKNR